MAEPILQVRNLHTHFFADEGVIRAVDGASFDLFAGRTLGIVGESGCGKSVTARSILRIVERPGRIVSGEILLRRQRGAIVDLTKLPADGIEMRDIRGGDVGLVFQEPMSSLSAFHTIGNQLIEAVRLHARLSRKAARIRAIELLAMAGIPRPDQRIDAYSFELSGGLRQRVMIALALAGEPRVLIADEPTTALDVTTQAQILTLIRRLQQERDLAVILITHDMGVIAEMADDVVVMYLGKEVENGPVDAIFHAPRHPYTRSLLRSIPSVLARPRSRLATITGSIPHPYARPAGCPFHPRCPDKLPGICDTTVPAEVRIGERHATACHLYTAERVLVPGNGVPA
jgi:peptide/nickel transport system ATP-binding protein